MLAPRHYIGEKPWCQLHIPITPFSNPLPCIMSHVGKVSVGRSIVVVLTIKHILNVAISITWCSPNTIKSAVIVECLDNPVLVSEYQTKQCRGVSVKQHLVTFLHIKPYTSSTISCAIRPIRYYTTHGKCG